jgi:hypothetical protein
MNVAAVNRAIRILKSCAERFVFSTKSIHVSRVFGAKSKWKEFKDSFMGGEM